MDLDMDIYVIWGPSAEWADGDGPLAFWLSKEEALADVAERRQQDREMAEDIAGRKLEDDAAVNEVIGWPYNLNRGYRTERTTLRKWVSTPEEVTDLDEEGLMQYLNEFA